MHRPVKKPLDERGNCSEPRVALGMVCLAGFSTAQSVAKLAKVATVAHKALSWRRGGNGGGKGRWGEGEELPLLWELIACLLGIQQVSSSFSGVWEYYCAVRAILGGLASSFVALFRCSVELCWTLLDTSRNSSKTYRVLYILAAAFTPCLTAFERTARKGAGEH